MYLPQCVLCGDPGFQVATEQGEVIENGQPSGREVRAGDIVCGKHVALTPNGTHVQLTAYRGGGLSGS